VIGAMGPALARMALRQTSLTEVLGLVAYAEGFALVVGSLGLGLEPRRVVRHAFKLVVDGQRPWHPARRGFPAHVRAVAHAAMADRLRLEGQARAHPACPVEEVRMAAAQIGGLAGVAELAHSAGELMVFHRADDAAMITAAVGVCDAMRARLEQIASRDDVADVDTAPIPIPIVLAERQRG
jgi:hypothetical protein